MNIARKESVDVQRLRRQVAFDRLLCRLFKDPNAPWLLKGGYAMELRIAEGRTTRDVDLAIRSPIAGRGKLNDRIRTVLQDEAAIELGDFFTFAIGSPKQDLDGAPYGGARYPVEARMDGRIFARFHLDVGTGDAVLEPTEVVHGRDWLGFADLPAGSFPTVSKEQQFAEKIHAYTLPRKGRSNTRVRDLVDLYLLIRIGPDPDASRKALAATFKQRAVHSLERELPPPPDSWVRPFEALAAECRIDLDCQRAFAVVASFYATLAMDS